MIPSGKFPFSVLQELCSKRKLNVTHEVLENDTPSHIPTFWYQITCNDFVTQGQGRTKKEAKHDAAKNMLEILKNNSGLIVDEDTNENSIADDSIIPPSYESKLKENAVVPLCDLCSEYTLPSPNYENIREEGPAHAKVFTMRCSIKSFGVESTERTKKQAKQHAALQMITLLKKSIDCRNSPEATKNDFSFSNTAPERDFQEAVSLFSNSVTNINFKYRSGELTSNITNNHFRFQKCEALNDLVNQNKDFNKENATEKLNSLLKQAEINYSLVPIQCNEPNKCIAVLLIDLSPKLIIHEIGKTYTETAEKVAIKALQFLEYVYVSENTENMTNENTNFETLLNIKKT